MELFTCESLALFARPLPPPQTAKPISADPISAIPAHFFAGDFPQVLMRANEILSGDARLRDRGFALHYKAHVLIITRDIPRAQEVVSEIAKLTEDPFLSGVHAFVQGLMCRVNENPLEEDIWAGRRNSQRFFQQAADTFLSLNEHELAVRALSEVARVKFTEGKFFSAIETVEDAVGIIQTHGLDAHIGRLRAMVAGTCGDQGYRCGIEERLLGALEWCDRVGDAVGRIESLTSLGRVIGYVMPSNQPELADTPDAYFRKALKEAEGLGLTDQAAGIESLRTWLFQKAGLQASVEPKEEREELVASRLEEAALIDVQIRQNTVSRLYDGVEDSHDVFLVYDALRNDDGECRDLNTLYRNRSADRIYQQSGRQIYLYSEARLLPQLAGLDDPILAAANDRVSFDEAHEFLLDGESHWLQRKIFPSGDGAVVLLRDISAEKKIESALRDAASSAERSERAKTAFLASMSHEIRTPLNGVLGLARMLSETNLDGIQQSYVDDIVLSGDLLLALIGDVLDLSKIESHEMRLAPTTVSLPSLVASIIKLFRGQAEEKGTSLSFRVDAAVPDMVEVDGVRLRQILANLVGNAVKFTREGEVEIRVAMDRDSAGHAVFEVRDTGIGIPPERLIHIFDRFQQASDPGFGGTGLGLTITRALAELMEGEVSVSSELGKGSTFQVRLPLKEAEEVIPEPAEKTPQRFDGRRVLLVDDNRVNLLVSSHTLRKFGCDVTIAEDGSKALELLSTDRFDIVFMDVRMPVMNGLETTQEIRRREAGRQRTPVVALTAGALIQEQQECFDAGMDDFATKPITSDAIGEVLARWLVPRAVPQSSLT